MAKSTKYFAARPFSDGNHVYGRGAPVPLRQPGEGPECGIRESQVENLLRTGLLTAAKSEQESAEKTEQESPSPPLPPVQSEKPAAKPAKKKQADDQK